MQQEEVAATDPIRPFHGRHWLLPYAAPDVAGTYLGPITLTITDAPGQGPMRDTGQLTATVTQSGATVTISATARWPWGDQAVWSNVVGTIDTVGTFTGPAAEGPHGPGLRPRALRLAADDVHPQHDALYHAGRHRQLWTVRVLGQAHQMTRSRGGYRKEANR